MAFTLRELLTQLDHFAPFDLAYDWDNVGLQVGHPDQPVHRVMAALEVTDRAIEHAVKNKIDTIIAHHPLLFKSVKSLRGDNPVNQRIARLIENKIALIAAHTNLDRVLHGTNGALAALVELRDKIVFEPAAAHPYYKFTVYVPRDYTPKIIEAIHRGGGGQLGNYSHCTFRAPGTGTYTPEEGSHPFQGKLHMMEEADEDRLETLVDARNLTRVLKEVRQAHPYEEVAFDVFPLHNAEPNYGLGVAGVLPRKITLRKLALQVAEVCGEKHCQFAGDGGRNVNRVVIVTGSAGSTVQKIGPSQADVIITGELSYHLAMETVDRGVGVIAVGHAASERIFAPHFCELFARDAVIAEANLDLVPFTDFPEPWQLVQKSEQQDRKGRK